MASTVAAARRVLAAAETGKLAELGAKHRLDLVVLFGSAAQAGTADPGDVDVAVRFEHGAPQDVLGVLNDLSDLACSDDIDLMVLNRAGPVARERALVGGIPLYQGVSGAFVTAQMAAVLERMDTDHLRRLDLELMAQ